MANGTVRWICTVEEIDKIWRALVASENGDEAWRNAVATSVHPERVVSASNGQMINHDGSLGLAVRLILLEQALCTEGRSRTNFLAMAEEMFLAAKTAELSDALGETAPKITPREHGYFRKLLQLANSSGPDAGTLPNAVREGFALWLRNKSNVEVSPHDLFEEGENYTGKEAVQRYLELLGNAPRIYQPFLGYDLVGRSDGVERAAETLFNRVRSSSGAGPDGAPRTPAIVEVMTRSLWTAQVDIARLLVNKLSKTNEKRPILVLPVSARQLATSDKSKTRVIECPDVTITVARLRRFFRDGCTTKALLDVPPLDESESLTEAIHEIRLAMIENPSIVVITGLEQAASQRTELARHIANNDMLRLISRLTGPPLCSSDDPNMLARWRSNCLVLISDSSVIGSLTADSIPRPDGLLEEVKLEIDKQEWLDWPRRLLLTDERTIRDYIASSVEISQRTRSETILQLIDTLLHLRSLHSRQAEETALSSLWEDLPANRAKSSATTPESLWIEMGLGKDEPNKSSDSSKTSALVSLILEELATVRPAWLELLSIFVRAPDGLRRRTLARLLQHINNRSRVIIPVLAELGDDNALDGELDSMLATLHVLVTEGGRDEPGSGDTVMSEYNVLEIPLVLAAQREHSPRAVQFVYAELRRAVFLWVGRHQDKFAFHAIHQALADDAIEQQTGVLLYTESAPEPPAWVWRRQLSVFYHGLQGLQIEKTTAAPGIRISIENNDTDRLTQRGAAFWKWLYHFALRHQLERAPAYNLTRHYGLEKLKSELLLSFDHPELLWPVTLQARYPLPRTASLVHLLDQHHESGLFANHRRTSARTFLSLGNVDGVRRCVEEIRNIKPSNGAFEGGHTSYLTCLKIRLDAGSMGVGVTPSDSQDALDYFADCINEELLVNIRSVLHKTMNEILELVKHPANEVVGQRAICLRFTTAEHVVDKCLAKAGWQAGDVASLIDLTYRFAESHAINADLNTDSVRTAILDEAFDVLKIDSLGQQLGRIQSYAAALSVFVFAEAMRTYLFEQRPTSMAYFASGHVSRQMIRVALDLEEVRLSNLLPDAKISSAPFALYARRRRNTLVRYLFRYPREQASLRLIDADILRATAFGSTRKQQLLRARQKIARAEPVVLGFGRETRLRLRLATCRAHVHHKLAQIGDKQSAHYRELGEMDIRFLEDHPHSKLFGYWERMASVRRKEFERS